MKRKTLIKLGIVAILLAGLPWLFLRTVRNTIAEPYAIDMATLNGWRLEIQEEIRSPALIILRPPDSLVPKLFQQIFHRTMESMTTPAEPAMAVVLQEEFSVSLRQVLSAQEILEVARSTGLNESRLSPVCMAIKREPSRGRTRQLYFVVFEASSYTNFREELARLYRDRGGQFQFEPTALELVLPIASSDANFSGWWPLDVDRDADCQAPLA